MLVFDTEQGRFNYRVAGVCVRDGHVLLHRGESEDFWSLPGGRPELGETSAAALAREMHEEIGLAVDVGRLLWVVENFFTYEERDFHELAFYYEMTLPRGAPVLDVAREFRGAEGALSLIFRWFPTDRLEDIRLFPTFFRTTLGDLPVATTHVVHADRDG